MSSSFATELDRSAETALALADIAGSVIRPYFRAALVTDDKADESPVTIADRTAERVMRAVLAERHADHAILGEEFGLSNEGSLWQWTLDPIDGTRAFITGRPTFGTLISLMYEDRPVLGVIDQPVTGERWVGVEGRRTVFSPGHLQTSRTDGPCRTRPCASLSDADLSCTSVEMLESAPRPVWNTLKSRVKRVSWGGDCYVYGLLALGHVDIVAECAMKPWDWSALVPVVEGAGGRMTDWDGQPLRGKGRDGTVLAVGDPALLDEAIACLRS